MYELGIDTGGTFSDFVLRGEVDGSLRIYKELSTPEDPSLAVMKGIETAERKYQISPSQISRIVYGTTVATNALIENKGAKVGLLTTRGFRDVLEIRRQWRPRLFDLYYVKPEPLVSRSLRLEIDERIDAKGQVLRSIQTGEIRQQMKVLVAEGVESIAVSFLFSFLNPAHEAKVAEIIEEEFPEVPVSISSKICPEMREYERTATTVLNAYLMPIISKYLRRLRGRLMDGGIVNPLRIMQSNGGLMRSEDIEEAPVNTLLSGPVGGVVGSAKLARQLGLTNIITLDMGGTSTDISLIQDGKVELITEAEIAYQPVKVPQVNIHTIGAGGGSLIGLFGSGLKVGPQSAGANPGPVCYRRGGEQPTTTDAALQLGYLDPDYFLGGEMRLDYERSRQAITSQIAKPLNLSVEDASYAALLIQSVNIEGGIRAVSLEKGYDPREFILLSFGGASGLFVGRVAQQLSIPKVLVPRETAVFSALGLLMADIRRTRSLTRVIPVNQTRSGEVKTIFDRLEDEIREALKAEGGSSHEMELERSCDMRYVGQAYEINVPFPEISRAITDQTLGELCRRFHLDHRKRFGHSAEEEPVEIVSSRVLGILPVRKREFTPTEATGKDPLKGYRKAYFGKEKESIRCPVYERKHMGQGHLFKGPAIVEDPVTTIIIYPDQSVELDPMGNLILYTSHKE